MTEKDLFRVEDYSTKERNSSTGVLLLNMGGPETVEEVFPFLYNLFKDPDIVPLPKPLRLFSPLLSWIITISHLKKSKEGYKRIGGGSPQRKTVEETKEKLKVALLKKGIEAEVFVAMRYWKPFTRTAVEKIVSSKIQNLIVVPLYPQYSTTTTMSSYRELYRWLKKYRFSGRIVPILNYSEDPGYLKLVIGRIQEVLKKSSTPPEETVLLFSAHSIPVDRVRDLNDPYPEQVEKGVRWIQSHLPPSFNIRIGYQSKLGPVPWLEPSTESVLKELGKEGWKRVVMVPISFTCEHIETLDEMDIYYKEIGKASGIEELDRVPTVQSDDDFIAFLADLVERSLKKPPALSCLRKEKVCYCLPQENFYA